jgi:hypothetical protein
MRIIRCHRRPIRDFLGAVNFNRYRDARGLLAWNGFCSRGDGWDREMEGRATLWAIIDVQHTAMSLNNDAADGQANS